MKGKLWWIVCAAALAVCAAVLALSWQPVEAGLPRDRDQEFRDGSGIRLSDLTPAQEDGLYTLAKVWGFVKYRHPAIQAGEINWDAELFRVMPQVVAAHGPDEVNAVLCRWLERFPYADATGESAADWGQIQQQAGTTALDLSWISDRAALGETLCGYLEGLARVEVTDRRHGYAAFPGKDIGETVDFSAEQNLPLEDSDTGTKLLAVFRLWNAFEYYSPYRALVDGDWDDALRQGIHTMLAAEDSRDYLLALAAMMAKTGDNHLFFSEPNLYLLRYFGDFYLPCQCRMLDGAVVVEKVADGQTALCPGDRITAIDGTDISRRVDAQEEVFPVPAPGKYGKWFYVSLVSTAGEEARVTVERDGTALTLSVKTQREIFWPENALSNGLMADGRIGYIDPAALEEGEVEELMESFADTRGIIVDLRQYPSVLVMYLLGEYFTPEPRQFAALDFPNPTQPGSFYRIDSFYSGAGWSRQMGLSDRADYPLYQGKIILLMDEFSQSQSEFTLMALRQAPRAVVVGSPSIGADGDVVTLRLPGSVQVLFTGLGVVTPDGGQTQRVGLEPDVYCRPTAEDLRQGRDPLMETAASLILEE